MSAPWETSWAVYVRFENDQPCSIMLDLGGLAGDPDPGRPVLVVLEFALRTPTAEGLISREERAAVSEFEERLRTFVTDTHGAWYVGHVVTAGRVTQHFYGAPELLDAQDLAPSQAPYAVETATHGDPSWMYYRDSLAPTAADRRQMGSVRVMHALKEHGDPMTTERMVDWTITAPDAGAAAAVAADLQAAGYAVSHPSPLAVTGTRLHSLELLPIIERQEEVAAIAERHACEYDGWGSPIVTEPPAPKRRRWGLRRGI